MKPDEPIVHIRAGGDSPGTISNAICSFCGRREEKIMLQEMIQMCIINQWALFGWSALNTQGKWRHESVENGKE